MQCLYASDYGPPDPGFDPAVGGGVLLRGFEDHRAVLMRAQSRTVATSLTVLLSIAPFTLIGGEEISGFGWAVMFGIVVGTSSSIFIASPILLFLGENRLRPALHGGKPKNPEPARA